MSNILIIKHGSLGDLIQANGAIRDMQILSKQASIFTTAQPAQFASNVLILMELLLTEGYLGGIYFI